MSTNTSAVAVLNTHPNLAIERWENEGGIALTCPETTAIHATDLARVPGSLIIMNETEEYVSPAIGANELQV